MAEDSAPIVVNVNHLSENERFHGDHYGIAYKCLTPSMLPRDEPEPPRIIAMARTVG